MIAKKSGVSIEAPRPTSRFWSVPGAEGTQREIRIHTLEWPSVATRPLLFLHGGGAHAHWWSHIAPRFADTHRPFALDLRGHGDSDHSPNGYPPDVLAHDVESVIDQLGGSAEVIGASLGGIVALRVASRGRIRRLVVVDSPPQPPANIVENRALLARPKRYPSREEAIRRFRLMPPDNAARPELLRYIAEHSIRPTGDGSWTLKYDTTLFATPAPRPLYEVLSSVVCPVLYVRGEKSELVSEAMANDVVRRLPRARTITIAGAHHHVFLDRPEELVAAAREFLAED